MIAQADVQKPPAVVRYHVQARYVFVIKGNPWNGFYRVRVWCTKLSCGPTTLDDLGSSEFISG